MAKDSKDAAKKQDALLKKQEQTRALIEKLLNESKDKKKSDDERNTSREALEKAQNQADIIEASLALLSRGGSVKKPVDDAADDISDDVVEISKSANEIASEVKMMNITTAAMIKALTDSLAQSIASSEIIFDTIAEDKKGEILDKMLLDLTDTIEKSIDKDDEISQRSLAAIKKNQDRIFKAEDLVSESFKYSTDYYKRMLYVSDKMSKSLEKFSGFTDRLKSEVSDILSPVDNILGPLSGLAKGLFALSLGKKDKYEKQSADTLKSIENILQEGLDNQEDADKKAKFGLKPKKGMDLLDMLLLPVLAIGMVIGLVVKKLMLPFTILNKVLGFFSRTFGLGKLLSKIPFVTKFFSTVGNIFSWFGKIGGSIAGFISKIPAVGKIFGMFAKGFSMAGKIFPFLQAALSIFDFVTGWMETDGDIFDKFGGALKKVVSGLIEMPLKLLDWVLGKLGFETKIAESTMNFINGLIDISTKVFRWIWDAIVKIGSAIGSVFMDVYNAFDTAKGGFVDKLWAGFKELLWKWTMFPISILSSAWDYLAPEGSKVGDYFKTFFSEKLDWVKNNVSKLFGLDKVFDFFGIGGDSSASATTSTTGNVVPSVATKLAPQTIDAGLGTAQSQAQAKIAQNSTMASGTLNTIAAGQKDTAKGISALNGSVNNMNTNIVTNTKVERTIPTDPDNLGILFANMGA